MLALLAAKGVFYLVLAVHFLHYRALTGRADSRLLAACAPIFGTFGSYEALLDARAACFAALGSGGPPSSLRGAGR